MQLAGQEAEAEPLVGLVGFTDRQSHSAHRAAVLKELDV